MVDKVPQLVSEPGHFVNHPEHPVCAGLRAGPPVLVASLLRAVAPSRASGGALDARPFFLNCVNRGGSAPPLAPVHGREAPEGQTARKHNRRGLPESGPACCPLYCPLVLQLASHRAPSVLQVARAV